MKNINRSTPTDSDAKSECVPTRLNIVSGLKSKFEKLFKKNPLIIRSPGRINLIGEHTSLLYNC
jgi:hypothetical protein